MVAITFSIDTPSTQVVGSKGQTISFCESSHVAYQNIYILNVAALDETIIPSCLYFSMQNIEQSGGLGRASRWSNVNVNQ